jgi:hypothetical protein
MKNDLLRMFIHIALVAILAFNTSAGADEPNADIYGTWKITALIGGGSSSGLSERQVRRLIGKHVIITPQKFSFNGTVCLSPAYQRSKEDTVVYFDREWRTRVTDIPFPEEVTIIETPGCDFLFPIRENHLMIAEDGNFLEAVRIKKLSASSTSR